MSMQRPGGGAMRGGPMAGMMGAPPAKSKNFKGSLSRLLNELKPERHILITVFALITSSVTIGAFGPKILGRATNEIFNGFIGKKLPSGLTKDQIVAGLRMKGEKTQADMLARSSVVPGHGMNFTTISHFLYLAIALYVISSLFMWIQAYLMAGVTNRLLNVSAGGMKYQIMVIDTRAESGIRVSFCQVLRCFFLVTPAMLSFRSSRTVWGQNQPHQILPKMMVTKAMKSRKKRDAARIR